MSWASEKDMRAEVGRCLFECLNLSHASIGSELQAAAINKLADLYDQVCEFWAGARARGNEGESNHAFGLLRFISGTASFLRLWLKLKQDEMADAWDCLVDAQGQIECGLRVLDSKELREVVRILHTLEQLLFPPQQFVSSSVVFEYATCTICGGVYGDCGHVAGRLYMGLMCAQKPENGLEFNHMAYVKDPHDKGCRVTEIQQGNRMICMITKQEIREAEIREVGAVTHGHRTAAFANG